MSDTSPRRQHLLALARDCERQAAQLSRQKGRGPRFDCDRYWRLAAIYREMAQWAPAEDS